MFGWFKSKRAGEDDKKFLTDMMQAAAEGDRLHRLRQAIATVSPHPLQGDNATQYAANAAATLSLAIVTEVGASVENDDDIFVTGTFAFVFADYFAMLLGGQFETASSVAVLALIGRDEFHRSFNVIKDSFNGMIQSKPQVLEAIGKTTEAWFKNPSPENFQQLTRLFRLLRDHVAEK